MVPGHEFISCCTTSYGLFKVQAFKAKTFSVYAWFPSKVVHEIEFVIVKNVRNMPL